MKNAAIDSPTSDEPAVLLESGSQLLAEVIMNSAFGFGTFVTATIVAGKPIIRASAIELVTESEAAFDATCDQVFDAVAAHSTYLSSARHHA